ncbi:MAG: hypothetical protein WAL15_13220, partial [Xanthobacteraceae bacterium]
GRISLGIGGRKPLQSIAARGLLERHFQLRFLADPKLALRHFGNKRRFHFVDRGPGNGDFRLSGMQRR